GQRTLHRRNAQGSGYPQGARGERAGPGADDAAAGLCGAAGPAGAGAAGRGGAWGAADPRDAGGKGGVMAKRRKGKTATAPATDVAIGYGVAHEIVRILQRYGAQRFANSVDKGNAILAIAAIRIPVPVTDA